ncbi:hypothetical protein QE152_g13359 [Popillia japonica]|uniref:Uncharacterized protein n=1 Tax=Popillia japonica TaxID=7064 RepID=A0AAW1LA83_POPJA
MKYKETDIIQVDISIYTFSVPAAAEFVKENKRFQKHQQQNTWFACSSPEATWPREDQKQRKINITKTSVFLRLCSVSTTIIIIVPVVRTLCSLFA